MSESPNPAPIFRAIEDEGAAAAKRIQEAAAPGWRAMRSHEFVQVSNTSAIGLATSVARPHVKAQKLRKTK